MKVQLEAIYDMGIVHRAQKLMVAYGAKEITFGVSFNTQESLSVFTERLDSAIQGARQAQVTLRAIAPPSAADELAKFAQLRDAGVLTEAEFAAKKAQLLDSRREEAAVDRPSRYELYFESSGPKPVKVMKVIRQALGLDLKAAKKLVDAAPGHVTTMGSLEQAEALQRRLQDAGAIIVIKTK